MAVDWMNNFVVPLIEVIFVVGIFAVILFFIVKAFRNAWLKAGKFWFKYKFMRKTPPEKILKWCLECIEKGIGWYDAKKLLFINMHSESQINEILWIYDEVINQLNSNGGNYGREFKRCNSQTQIATTELPKF